MNLSIEDDEEPMPYPTGDFQVEEVEWTPFYDDSPRRPERMSVAEGTLIWGIVGCAIAMVVWVVYGMGLAAYHIGRFLWRML